MTDKKRCARQVYTEAREVRGHKCGNFAVPGSDFCTVHQPGYTNSAGTASAKSPGEVSASRWTIYFASLQWDPGQGPLVKIPYSDRSGYITFASAKATDDQPPEYQVRGVHAKKNGAVAATTWNERYGSGTLPAECRAQLAALINEQRS